MTSAAARLELPGVIAIEVWDLPVAGKLLQEWRDDATFAARVADAVLALRDEPPPAFTTRARAAAAELAHVHLVGGAADAAICDAIARRGLPCTRAADPFAAARAGATLRPGALCADVGQTAIKLVHGERAWRVERDLVRAPLRDEVAMTDRFAARASTVQFLASLLGAETVVLGLPCEIDPSGVPRSCTYCWQDPDPDLVADLSRIAGSRIEIVNDAELAAAAARLDPQVPRTVTTLVLTIGFGVGGALLLASP